MLLIVGCGPTRRLADDERLLVKNQLHIQDPIKIDRGELDDIIKQQPNQRFLGTFKLSLWAHNLPNPEKVAVKAAKKRALLAEKNEKRIEQGKRPKRYKRTFGEWLQTGIGDPPVVLDSSLSLRSANQISLYLLKEGYFQNEVDYHIKHTRKQRAVVHYDIIAGPEYKIRNIKRVVPDPNLAFFVEQELKNSNIAEGQRFSVARMDAERQLLITRFKNEGYYDMTQNDIYFQVDSTIAGRKVDLVMGVHPLRKPDPLNSDSLINHNHIRYRIGDIIVNRSHDPFRSISGMDHTHALDTTLYHNYVIMGEADFRIKPNIIAQNIRFEKGDYYNQHNLESTHRSLSALEIFNAVNIKFERQESDTVDQGLLTSHILLTPAKKQQFVFETRGTHNSGFFGAAGSISYKNRNFLRGAEVFRIKLSGGIEAQQLLTGSSSGSETTTNIIDQGSVFNTIELVPEISLTIPKFLFPIKLNRIAKSARPFTTLSVSYGYQRRPDFTRNVLKTMVSYRWRESQFKTWIISPVEVSLIKIFKSDQFQQRLDDLNDLFLNASYSDHLISALKVSYIFNNQVFSRRANSFYYRGNAETAGNVLNGAMAVLKEKRDTLGSYRIANIRYAHYVRTDHDLRYYRRFSDNNSLVFRAFGGVGVPLRNLEVLPFERSFFGGGANGIRAWQIQTLGPGSYQSVVTTFDRIGEMQIEFNVEYRQKLISVLEGALFVDAGNIWLLKPDPVRLQGNFAIDRFMKEFAVGVGIGVRLNFDFFVIRFDLAMQLHDPAMALGERWAFQPKDEFNQRLDIYNNNHPTNQLDYYSPRFNLNLGIGYPF